MAVVVVVVVVTSGEAPCSPGMTPGLALARLVVGGRGGGSSWEGGEGSGVAAYLPS